MGTINYKEKGLEREEVLCALYNHSKPLCIGSAIHNTVWVARLSKRLDD